MAMKNQQPSMMVSLEDFENTPQGRQDYWQEEIRNSQKMLQKWHRQADRITQRYLDEGTEGGHDRRQRAASTDGFRLNLFYSSVQTMTSLLYGRVPRVDVKRRYSDANDDVARVASTLLERLLNNDMADNPTQYDSVLRAVLQDRLVPGMGVARARYEVSRETVVEAAVTDVMGNEIRAETTREVVADEKAPLDYFHWRDMLWSWARTPGDLRWMAFRSFITKDEAKERYGDKVAENTLSYETHYKTVDENSPPPDPTDNDYWMKAEIWEIWDKTSRRVLEFHKDAPQLLKSTPDPLRLSEFFPAPPFLMANPTTAQYKPTPDFNLSQDLYNAIDMLQTRIAIITEAVRCVGVYDAQQPEISRIFKEALDNDMIPVNSPMLAEKGGLKGVIDWFPIEACTNALIQLRTLRDETIALLYQTTGMGDVMRGSLDNQYEGVGQTRDKVQFGSVRVQKLQEEYATFASNLMALKAEIICKHFEPQTIFQMSNAQALPEDPNLVQAAVMLLKDYDRAKMQVSIKAESLAMVDYTRLRAERGEFMEGVSTFLASAAPIIEQEPGSLPYLMQMMKWTMAGYRGADEIEGVMDQMIGAAQQAQAQKAANPQPDPEQAKMQAQMQLEKMKAQNQLQAIQAKTKSDMAIRESDRVADIDTKLAEHEAKMAEMERNFRVDAELIRIKSLADMQTEQVTSAVNIEQQVAGVEAEMTKDLIVGEAELEREIAESALRVREAKAVQKTKPESSSDD